MAFLSLITYTFCFTTNKESCTQNTQYNITQVRQKHEDELNQFDQRIREFHGNGGCGVNFFMTWISPACEFGDRQFISLDSLFKTNPDGCLVILSKTMDSEKGNMILDPFVVRGYRVLAVTPDLPFLFQDTPAGDWFKELKRGNVDPGVIPLAQNLSNLLRLVYLYKYGGVYLDTDVIVLKGFHGLRNTIGAQSIEKNSRQWTRLNNAVLVFDKGHPLVLEFIEEFARTFDGSKWGHNGPYLVSRVVERADQRGKKATYGHITVLPPVAFYPVDWIRIGSFFKHPGNLADKRWVEAKVTRLKQETYVLHLWNKQSKSLVTEEGSVIGKLVSEFCVICREMYSC
ncbi:hypothetical protein Dimus_025039 [Dionaea muscipula]